MAKQAPLRNKAYWLLFGLFGAGCQPQPEQPAVAVPSVYQPTRQAGWQRRSGRLWLSGKPFSGWQYELGPANDTLFVGAYVDGKAEGEHRFWHPNHRLKESRRFRNGWQEGPQRGWFESGKPAFVYHFRNDVYEGSRKEWYPNGQPARDGNYQNGQEAGRQQQWFADGSLKANYAVRNGRAYGFTGVKNCVNVWDSIAVTH